MVLTVEALRRYGVRLSPQDMEDLLFKTLDEITRPLTLPDPHRELAVEEAKALEGGGFDLSPVERVGVDDPITRTAVLYAVIRADSLSVQEAAALLKVNESRVRQLLGSRVLYGFKDGHVWRIPRFQFEGDHLVPGLDRVMPFLSADLHPVEVYTWFTTPDTDLESDNGAPLSPYDWLRGGRLPDPVAS